VEVEPIAEIVEIDDESVDSSLGLIIEVCKAEGTKCDRC